VTRRGLILFIALGIAWGIPYLFIKVAVSELEPQTVVLARAALAAVLLVPIAAFRHEIMPVLRRWKPMLAFTVIEIVLPWYFLNSAEQRIPSSTAGLLISAVPLAAVGVAFVLGRRAKLTWINWLGIVVGMAGVAALVGFEIGGSDLIAVVEIAIVVIGYALGPAILAHWIPELPGIGITAVSLAALAVVCSALAFILMVALVTEIGPFRATAITYVNPAVAILAGAIFLSEEITQWTILGFVLVLSGSYLVTKGRREVPVVPSPTTEEPESQRT
jgi:drug/metabolite transporter (DMT)-like permease